MKNIKLTDLGKKAQAAVLSDPAVRDATEPLRLYVARPVAVDAQAVCELWCALVASGSREPTSLCAQKWNVTKERIRQIVKPIRDGSAEFLAPLPDSKGMVLARQNESASTIETIAHAAEPVTLGSEASDRALAWGKAQAKLNKLKS